MATNPVVKLKRGVAANLVAYPLIDGQMFLASSTDTYLTAAMARSAGEYNVFFVDKETNGSTTRYPVDAYRAIYAATAAEAAKAAIWSAESAFSITDGTHSGTIVNIDGSEATYALPLPATISAAFIGNLTGTADKAKAMVDSTNALLNVGSATRPVYFSNGVPVQVNTSIAVSITGNAATADAWSSDATFYISDNGGTNTGSGVLVDGSAASYTLKLPTTIVADLTGTASQAAKLTTNAGSATRPVYFANGVPVQTNATIDVSITGNANTANSALALSSGAGSDGVPVYIDSTGLPTAVTILDATKLSGIIPLACIPKGAQERLSIYSNLTTIKALTDTDVQYGDVVKDAATGQMYYVTEPTVTGATKNNAQTLGFVQFSAGNAASAAYADSAGSLISSPTIGISGGATGTATTFAGSDPITIPVTALDLTYVNNGVLGVTYGGTGNSSWTQYGIVYADTTSSLSQLGLGTSTQILKSNGSTGAPSWISQSELTAGKASALAAAVNINGTSFDGTDDITTAVWGQSRNISIASSDGTGAGTAVGVNGSQAVTLLLPATIKANLTGKADTAGTADGLAHQLHYTVTDITGSNSRDDVIYGSASANADTYYDLEPDDLFPSYKISGYASTIAKGTWTALTLPNGITTGSYIVQIKAYGNNFSNEFFTGVMSYSTASCGATQSDSDEVFLHAAGQGLSEERVYMRTRRVPSGNVVVEICCTCALTTSDKFDIIFRRMI